MALYTLYIDGAARNNPGPAGAGVYLKKDADILIKDGFFLGSKTNNQAEYYALLLGIYCALLYIKPGDTLSIFSDSQLLVRQMTGVYKTKDSQLRLFVQFACNALKPYTHTFTHVLRAKNKDADFLANVGIDTRNAVPEGFVSWCPHVCLPDISALELG